MSRDNHSHLWGVSCKRGLVQPGVPVLNSGVGRPELVRDLVRNLVREQRSGLVRDRCTQSVHNPVAALRRPFGIVRGESGLAWVGNARVS